MEGRGSEGVMPRRVLAPGAVPTRAVPGGTGTGGPRDRQPPLVARANFCPIPSMVLAYAAGMNRLPR
ncbi:hypothetical protein GCM10009570_31230 [Dietzia natronolimnaea]